MERGPRDAARASTYFESRVSNEASVVTEIGRVMLHHALGLWLAEVLIGGRKAAGRQHDGWTFWKKPQQSRPQNTETSSGPQTKASLRLCQHVCYGGLMSSTRTQRAWQWEQRKREEKKKATFSPFRELMVLGVKQEGCAQRGTDAGRINPKYLRYPCCVFVGIEGVAQTWSQAGQTLAVRYWASICNMGKIPLSLSGVMLNGICRCILAMSISI